MHKTMYLVFSIWYLVFGILVFDIWYRGNDLISMPRAFEAAKHRLPMILYGVFYRVTHCQTCVVTGQDRTGQDKGAAPPGESRCPNGL